MDEVRVFNGGMDLDSSPENLAPGDYREARNIRVTTSEGETEGRVNYLNDFVLDDAGIVLPSGANKTLRTVVSDNKSVKYVANYNSQGRHTIVEYLKDSATILFTNLDDTGGVDLLNWNEGTFINDFKLHLDKWIIFTTGENEVNMVDIEFLKNRTRNVEITDFLLIKRPPRMGPEAEYADSGELGSNNLGSKIFRFKFKYLYEGGLESVWSPTSSEVIPSNLNKPNVGNSVIENVLRVSGYIDTPSVTGVRLAMSIDGGEWLITREESVSKLQQLPSSGNTIQDTYVPGTRRWTFAIKDPYNYSLMTADEADQSEDAIPERVNSLDIVNNNVLLLAGLDEEQNRLEELDVDLDVELVEGRHFGIVGRGDLVSIRQDIVPSHGDYYVEMNYLQLEGVPTPGDVITIVHDYGLEGHLKSGSSSYNPDTADIYTYVVSTSDTDLTALYNSLANTLPDGSVFNDTNGEFLGWRYPDAGDAHGLRDWKTWVYTKIDLRDTGFVDTQTLRTFKRGSIVQFALSYRDSEGRLLPLETDSSFRVTFPTPNNRPTYWAQVNYAINHTPPENAVSYQWMVTDDNKHLRYTDMVGEFKPNQSKYGSHIVLSLDNLNTYVREGKGGVSYNYTPGDRAYVVSYVYGVSPNPQFGFSNDIDIEILKFEISALSDQNNSYLLYLKFNEDLWNRANTPEAKEHGVMIRVQMYTPKVSSSSETGLVDASLYKEIGPAMPIIDGQHSQPTGTLQGVEDFFRGRVYDILPDGRAFPYLIESRLATDEDAESQLFRGTTRSYNDKIVGLRSEGSIRFSDVSNLNTGYRGINKFFQGRIYGEGPGQTTARFGAITKINVVGNYLTVIQEDEVGIVPIYLSMVQDNNGNIETADSAQLLNTVRYLGGGKVGSGQDAKSFASTGTGLQFFFDNDRKIPYMLSGMTLTDISMKLGTFFSNKVDVSPIGEFVQVHSLFRHYYLKVKLKDGTEDVVMFEIGPNRWRAFTDNSPEAMANIDGEAYGFKESKRYILSKGQSNNSFYGEEYESILVTQYMQGFVRTFQSLAVHSAATPETLEDGIITEGGHVSDLVSKDFKQREGIQYANFLRDKPSGLFNGKLLKGTWIKIGFKFDPSTDPLLNLTKIIVKYKGSTPNE